MGLLAQPNREDSPLTRKIRMLENRLDKAMIKYNEAQSIRKTYEQIVKRLKARRQATCVNVVKDGKQRFGAKEEGPHRLLQ